MLFPPNLIQLIAVHVRDERDLLALLTALPPTLLSDPLLALRDLLGARKAGHLSLHTCLWPKLKPMDCRTPRIDDALVRCLPLYATLVLYNSSNSADITTTLPSTLAIKWKMRLSALTTPEMAPYAPHLGHVQLFVANDDAPTSEMVEAIASLPRLTSLDLLWDAPTPSDLLFLLRGILASPSIRAVQLRMGRDTTAFDGPCVMALTQLLTSKLHTLALVGVSLPASLTAPFVQGARSSRTLRALTLQNCSLCNDIALPQGVPWPRLLTSLHLEVAGTTDVDALAMALADTSSLQRLDLCAAVDGRMLPRSFLAQLASLKRLRHLGISGVSFEAPDALCAILPQLHSLHLDANDLQDAGLRALARALPSCDRLESLSLREQGATDASVLFVAVALQRAAALRVLDLEHNAIACVGAMALCRIAFRLKKLKLGYNSIGQRGAVALSHALASADHLQVDLNLMFNPLTRDGVLALVAAIERATCRTGVLCVYECAVGTALEKQQCAAAIRALTKPHMAITGITEGMAN
ncbi:hypothetical protein SPRG_13626 [Saprolegnia parasitica CBS 223.65]|uniref:RNI-like protein n=1 Tax=Saprolegnia parasitica (strain CBS 223.65) TaxID=695850 RepID=A0A067BVE7_SAPPC|nr:hypothetical protein SPRG_13626 [Saprolegnia parasitica CBS 223.65]KDO20810.1 hypothetical protein SPRG_13626 [Saprolegnia parasitica CBS 223.65]|eukprot:XP_012208469.1 hypothetical protein SPRG_13626 [Saprolegnia parasitica CBS 223.65]